MNFTSGLKVFGAGEWLQEKHGAKDRCTWKKLHLAVDADTGILDRQALLWPENWNSTIHSGDRCRQRYACDEERVQL
jgi:hypothetical protein